MPQQRSGLSGRQAEFARNVALGNVPAKAAWLAGYAPGSAARQAWRLLARPAVARRVAELREAARAWKAVPAELRQAEFLAHIDAAMDEGRLEPALRLIRFYDADLGLFHHPVPPRYGMDKNDEKR